MGRNAVRAIALLLTWINIPASQESGDEIDYFQMATEVQAGVARRFNNPHS
jgi:hypothetical protein